MSKDVFYPAEPPKQPPRNIFEHMPDRCSDEMGLWLTHDPAIYQDDVTGDYYIYGTDAIAMKSPDLIHWKNLGKVVPGATGRVPGMGWYKAHLGTGYGKGRR